MNSNDAINSSSILAMSYLCNAGGETSDRKTKLSQTNFRSIQLFLQDFRIIFSLSLSLSLRRVVGGDDNESRPMTSLDHQTVRRLESVSVWEKQRSLDLRGKVAENEKGARIILSAGHGFLRKWRNPLPDIADQRSFSQEGGGGKDGVNEGERKRERELANETISDYALT